MKKFLALLLVLVLVFSLAACGKKTEGVADQPGTEVEDTDAANADEEENTQGDASAENSDATPGYSIGVTEDGENVLVTANNQTDAGMITCVMTFWYENGAFTKETADYYLTDDVDPEELAAELSGDETIVSSSIQVDGNHVSCTIQDSETENLRGLSHDELLETMKNAVGAAN